VNTGIAVAKMKQIAEKKAAFSGSLSKFRVSITINA
jgi:hypothetical protein